MVGRILLLVLTGPAAVPDAPVSAEGAEGVDSGAAHCLEEGVAQCRRESVYRLLLLLLR